MDTVLGLQEAVGILPAFYLHRDGFDARLVAFLKVRNGYFVSAFLCPALVHTHEHGSPVLRFSAAGARIDFQDTLHRVFVLSQHVAQLESLDGGDGFLVVAVNLLFGDELVFVEVEGKLKLVGGGTHLGVSVYPFLDAFDKFHLLLGTHGVVPEVGSLRAEVFFFKLDFLPVDVEVSV